MTEEELQNVSSDRYTEIVKASIAKAKNSEDLLSIAKLVASENYLADEKWAKELIKASIDSVELASEYKAVALEIVAIFDDNKWARDVYKLAIEKANENNKIEEEVMDIENSIEDSSNWTSELNKEHNISLENDENFAENLLDENDEESSPEINEDENLDSLLDELAQLDTDTEETKTTDVENKSEELTPDSNLDIEDELEVLDNMIEGVSDTSEEESIIKEETEDATVEPLEEYELPQDDISSSEESSTDEASTTLDEELDLSEDSDDLVSLEDENIEKVATETNTEDELTQEDIETTEEIPELEEPESTETSQFEEELEVQDEVSTSLEESEEFSELESDEDLPIEEPSCDETKDSCEAQDLEEPFVEEEVALEPSLKEDETEELKIVEEVVNDEITNIEKDTTMQEQTSNNEDSLKELCDQQSEISLLIKAFNEGESIKVSCNDICIDVKETDSEARELLKNGFLTKWQNINKQIQSIIN